MNNKHTNIQFSRYALGLSLYTSQTLPTDKESKDCDNELD